MSEVAALVVPAMRRLSQRRPLFHSEADLQLALAWELQITYPDSDLRLEKRVSDSPRIELDVLFVCDGRRYGLELKYPRSKALVTIDEESFYLRTGAPDLDRYDVLRDIARLERLVALDVVDEGCAVVLTNARGLWLPPRGAELASYDAFRIHEGREVTGTLDWGATANAGTRIGREQPIVLDGRYHCKWEDFSDVGGIQLRHLLIPISAPPSPDESAELLA